MLKINNNEPPVAQLNNLMTKSKIVPQYEMIFGEKNREGFRKYMARVTLPLSPGGKPLSADGRFCQSKKEAKHDAALTFMKKYLNYESLCPPEKLDLVSAVQTADKLCYEGRDLLKKICLKNNLRRPLVRDICTSESSDSRTFIAECTVNHLSIEGQGNSRVEARLEATSKMMEILMETSSIHEILKSPDFMQSRLQLFSSGSSSDMKETKMSQKNDNSGKRKMDVRSPENHYGKFEVRSKPDVAKYLLEMMVARNKAKKIKRSDEKSVGNMKPINSDVVSSQTDTVVTKSSGIITSGKKDAVEFKNLTRLQAISHIDRCLISFEKELEINILNILKFGDFSYQQTVAINSHDYEMYIYPNAPTKIFEGKNICVDQSIRVACLTKLLMNFKRHIESNPIEEIKSEP